MRIIRIWMPRMLLQYRVTPHSETNVSPTQLMFNRQIKTRLDLIHIQASNRELL